MLRSCIMTVSVAMPCFVRQDIVLETSMLRADCRQRVSRTELLLIVFVFQYDRCCSKSTDSHNY